MTDQVAGVSVHLFEEGHGYTDFVTFCTPDFLVFFKKSSDMRAL